MQIQFQVENESAEFHRNWFTGGAELRFRGGIVPLQSTLNPATHFSMTLTKFWEYRIDGHEVVIKKVRPLLLAGFRPQIYQILIDGRVVAQKRGY